MFIYVCTYTSYIFSFSDGTAKIYKLALKVFM
jgi:hypothetical protein